MSSGRVHAMLAVCRRALAELVWRLLLEPLRSARKKRKFKADFRQFSSLAVSANGVLPVAWEERAPFFFDATATTGFDRHYVYHTAWAMRRVVGKAPDRHVDISSSLYFVSLLSAVIPVEFYDFRPADLHLTNLSCKAATLEALPFASGSVASLSCMHVIEHIGLGRYGDVIDPDGDAKAALELCRVLADGGSLLMVVPVGRARVCFNAHRVYSHGQVLQMFPTLQLKSFSLVPDAGDFIVDAAPEDANAQEYGCGCYEFVKSDLIVIP